MIAQTAATDSKDRSTQIATRESGPAPSEMSTRAHWFDASSSSR